ncbi:hypothetical protein BCT04_15585 [Vibrio breoganii]|uniref:thioesterase family protein n=1 Tax=Vibrio breoganii TaxID=553239 RepID=UPI0003137B60|nr:thioesterase family protein [Vibrio breoganii]OEF88184.1 hypothetical protein B003_00105 [Vibrio breoganii 1C10]PMO63640.1 hypothetical protein BCT04_15585 [Vibrio breoganii]
MHIDELLKMAERCVSGNTSMVVSQHWSQGDSVFGGLTAALLFHVTSPLATLGRPLYSVKTNFISSLLIDQPFTFEIELLHEDSRHSKVTGRIVQNDEVVVVQHSCFGQEAIANTSISNPPQQTPALPSVEQLPKFNGQATELTASNLLTYTEQVDFAIAKSPQPDATQDVSHNHGWMKLKTSPMRTTGAHLICLIDAWPTYSCSEMKDQKSGTVMMWNLEFPAANHEDLGTQWFAYQSDIRKMAGGYAHVEANIWSEDNRLVAISRQSVDLAS